MLRGHVWGVGVWLVWDLGNTLLLDIILVVEHRAKLLADFRRVLVHVLVSVGVGHSWDFARIFGLQNLRSFGERLPVIDFSGKIKFKTNEFIQELRRRGFHRSFPGEHSSGGRLDDEHL